MNRENLLYRLQLDHDKILDKNIYSVGAIELESFVSYRQIDLPPKNQFTQM